MGSDRHSSFSDENVADFDLHPTKRPSKHTDGSGVGMFKLADEAQMGGLNRLMIATEGSNGKCSNNNYKFMANSMEAGEERDDDKG